MAHRRPGADSDHSEDDDDTLHHDSADTIMARQLPLDGRYGNKQEVKKAIRLASAHAFGHGVRIDNSRSRGTYLRFICENATDAEESCQFAAVAHCKTGSKRRRGGSGGQASRDDTASYWRFKVFDTGLNYVPHSDDCIAKIRMTKDIVQDILSGAVSANPNVSGKAMLSHLSARLASLSAADAPSNATVYRARMVIRSKSNAYYNECWARIETYLTDFKQANPACHVVLEKDPDGRFKRYFVGVHASIEMLKHCGLDFYGVDACFTKHHIVSGMQLHLLCGRTGANTNIIIAWSLGLKESNDTYQWFAMQCADAGFGDLTRIAGGPLKRHPVCFTDGFKGTNHFSRTFPRLHPARCAMHLANAIRSTLGRWRGNPNDIRPVQQEFANKQVIAVCTAKTDAEYESALRKLNITSPSAAGRLLGYTPPETWSVNQMARKGIPTFGHCTSNVAEGTNDVLEPMRTKHPYEFLDAIVRYVSERTAYHQSLFKELRDKNKLLTEFASGMLRESRDVARARSYRVQRQANRTFLVWDPLSKSQASGLRADMYSWLLFCVLTTQLLRFVFLFARTRFGMS